MRSRSYSLRSQSLLCVLFSGKLNAENNNNTSQLKFLTTGLFYISSPQRLCHCVLHQLMYQHVCWLCNLLYCWLHGTCDKERHCRRSSFR